MQVKFWGTRGSYPRFASEDNVKYPSRHTPCIEVSGDSAPLFIDTGTGFDPAIRALFAKSGPQTVNVLLSHFHWDHLMGLFLIYDLYVQGLKIKIHSPFTDAERVVTGIFKAPYCPLDAATIREVFSFVQIAPDAEIGSLKIKTLPLPHTGETYGFSVKHANRSLFYASDFAIEAAKTENYKDCFGTDLLICDAFHRDEDKQRLGSLGHSSVTEAATFAKSIAAKKLALFHHSPIYNDQALGEILASAKRIFDRTILAVDSQVVEV